MTRRMYGLVSYMQLERPETSAGDTPIRMPSTTRVQRFSTLQEAADAFRAEYAQMTGETPHDPFGAETELTPEGLCWQIVWFDATTGKRRPVNTKLAWKLPECPGSGQPADLAIERAGADGLVIGFCPDCLMPLATGLPDTNTTERVMLKHRARWTEEMERETLRADWI